MKTDVTDPASIAVSIEDVHSTFGPVEALVHLVGAWKGGAPVQDTPLEVWDRMIDLNLTSAMLCCRAVLPSMRERAWGRIVLVSSRTAREERSGQAAYAIAKAGVAVLAETIAEENRGLDLTANVIAPSTLDSPANRKAMPDADFGSWGSHRGRRSDRLVSRVRSSRSASRCLATRLRRCLSREWSPRTRR